MRVEIIYCRTHAHEPNEYAERKKHTLLLVFFPAGENDFHERESVVIVIIIIYDYNDNNKFYFQ